MADGRVSVEVRSIVRDQVDMAAALLARCGTPARFFDRHGALMDYQATLFGVLTDDMQRSWQSLTPTARLPRIAQDTGMAARMEAFGVTPAAANRCLADQTQIIQLVAGSNVARSLGVQGTPSFTINETLLNGVHSWPALQPALDAALRLVPLR